MTQIALITSDTSNKRTNMLKCLRTIGLALLLLATFSPLVGVSCTYHTNIIVQSEPITAQQIIDEAIAPTVMVRAESGSGSGVVLNDGYHVLTAAHVVLHLADNQDFPPKVESQVEKCAVTKVMGGTLFMTDAKVVKLDEQADLAYLELKNPLPVCSFLRSGTPALQEKCWAAGHPARAVHVIVTEGRLQSQDANGPTKDPQRYYQFTSPVSYGNSGGPVFSFENRHLRVISIVQRGETFLGAPITHLAFGARLEDIKEFLDSPRTDYRPK